MQDNLVKQFKLGNKELKKDFQTLETEIPSIKIVVASSENKKSTQLVKIQSEVREVRNDIGELKTLIAGL